MLAERRRIEASQLEAEVEEVSRLHTVYVRSDGVLRTRKGQMRDEVLSGRPVLD